MQRAVDTDEAEEFAKQNGMLYVETSAKDLTTVNEVLTTFLFFFCSMLVKSHALSLKAFNSLCVGIVEKVDSGVIQTANKKANLVTNDVVIS